MDATELIEHVPFASHLGVEVHEAVDGRAAATLPLRAEHSSNPGGLVAHGGVTFALADTVGGAAVVSECERVAPTIDVRIDYLAPATDDLYAEATVARSGESVAVVDVDIAEDDDRSARVATARGAYKTGGDADGSPWTEGVDVEELF